MYGEGWAGLMAWNADRGWNGVGALERMSETRVELMDDCVMLFLGFGDMPEGVVDGFGTPRFNAKGREKGGREEESREETSEKDKGVRGSRKEEGES